jgi:hypothetical protein
VLSPYVWVDSHTGGKKWVSNILQNFMRFVFLIAGERIITEIAIQASGGSR